MVTLPYDHELDGLVSLPKLPWRGELPAAQRRALQSLDSSCTSSLMALERKGLVQWSGSHWFRTPFGQHIASALEQPLVTEVIKGPSLPKLSEVQRVAYRALLAGHSVMPGMMPGLRRTSVVVVLPSTLRALERMGLCHLRTGPCNLLIATRHPHRKA